MSGSGGNVGRIRTIKPELFRHKKLYELERDTGLPIRIAWAGLLTVADRAGRFRWDPEVIQLDVLPFDREVDFARVLEALWRGGFVQRYAVDGKEYGFIPSFLEHQVINHREAQSKIPAPDDGTFVHASEQFPGTPGHTSGELEGNRKGREEEKEGKGKGAWCAESTHVASATVRGRIIGPHPGLSLDDICVERLGNVPQDIQDAWLKAYPSPEWICQEIRRANVWLVANPKKNPKRFGSFMSNWLGRAFEDYRKGIPTNHKTASQKNADALSEMYQRVEKGEL